MSSPILYFLVPELRHLGREAWEFYFMPAHSTFYFAIINAEKRKAWKKLKHVIWAVAALKKVYSEASMRVNGDSNGSSKNKPVTIHPNSLEELKENKELLKQNQLSMAFVENILGVFNWLARHPNSDRFVLVDAAMYAMDGKGNSLGNGAD